MYQKIINFNYLKIKFILNITMDLNFSDDEENTLPSNNIEELPPMSDDEEEREYIQNILNKTRDKECSFSFNVDIKESKKNKKKKEHKKNESKKITIDLSTSSTDNKWKSKRLKEKNIKIRKFNPRFPPKKFIRKITEQPFNLGNDDFPSL